MIDKDLNELNVIKSKIPHASILLCKFHVLKYLKKKVSELDVKRAEKESLAATLQKLVNSKDNEEYSKAYNDLQSHDAEFVRYFNKNWHSCQDLWVIHERANLCMHGNNTNNKVESHNQKLKSFLNKQMRIPEAIENLSLFIDEC